MSTLRVDGRGGGGSTLCVDDSRGGWGVSTLCVDAVAEGRGMGWGVYEVVGGALPFVLMVAERGGVGGAARPIQPMMGI